MDGPATGAAQTAKPNRFREAGKIGGNEAVPPKGLATARAAKWLDPGKILAQTRNLVDVGSNTQYQ